MNSCLQFTSESKATIFVPWACACFSAGHTASGSLPAMTMPAACAWIAAWIAGCCAAAVSSVPEETTCVSPSAVESELAAPVGDHLVRVEGVLRDEVVRLAGRRPARGRQRGGYGGACHQDDSDDDCPSVLVHGWFPFAWDLD